MTSITATAGLILFLSAGLACGGERSPITSALRTQEAPLLVVNNEHWLDVTIYALRAGTRQRLGTVAGSRTDTIPIQNSIVAGAGSVRLLVEPIGSARAHATEPISVGLQDVIQLQVRNPLNLTSYTVVRR